MGDNSVNFYPNGIMIKALNTKYSEEFKLPISLFNYYGIEGDNWPIDKYSENLDKSDINFIKEFIYENVDNVAEYNRCTAVCNDIDFINYYIDCCYKANFIIDIFFVETELSSPICKINPIGNENFEFLGFDYAFPADDYFSSIFQEYKIISQFGNFVLNENGLFSTEEQIQEYIQTREELKNTEFKTYLEQGKFIIYKVWTYVGELPITI